MNDMTLHAFAPPQGFYTNKPDHSDPDPSPFNFASPTSPGPSAASARPRRLSTNRGGRPKDFVWSFFAGDREKAVCRSCSWSTERPKAFRMRQHILICPQMPDDVKESVKQAIDSKEQAQRVKEDASNRMGIVKNKKRKGDKLNDISALPASLRGIMDAPPSAVSADVVSDPSTHPLITCHVLDSTSGKPGAEMQIQLDHLTHSGYVSLAQSWTDADGRCNTLPIMPGMLEQNGTYRLTFHTGDYFKKLGIATFYPVVEITFITANATEPYHVPLLLSPFSYSTYRGS